MAAPAERRKRAVIVFRNFLFYEERDVPEVVANDVACPGSFIAFFKNGENQGKAFENIPEASYFPSFSLYRGAKMTLNFGPTFKHAPTSLDDRTLLVARSPA